MIQTAQKIIVFVVALLFVPGFVPETFAQASNDELDRLVEQAIERTKRVSLYSNEVDWESLSKRVKAKSKNAKSVSELKPAFEELLNGIRDHHGRVFLLSDTSVLATFTRWDEVRSSDKRPRDQSTRRVVNDTKAKFSYEITKDNIGYLRVVGVGPNIDGLVEARRIRKAVETLVGTKVDGWIVDLRYNGGGNANVMLSGLAPLLTPGRVASVSDNNGRAAGYSEIRDGEYWYFGVNPFPIGKSTVTKNPKIAVLTSRWTVSSGELVAAAFRGQKNTRFFGEKTGGYTTNTGFERIADRIALVIATGYFTDRNGVMYKENVPVDEKIPFRVETDISKDEAVSAATKWLIGKSQ